jgi:hypothetical protein
MSEAKFRFSAHDGIVEMEGSEEFLTKHFDSLTDIVRVMARHVVIDPKIPPALLDEESSDADQENSPSPLSAKPIGSTTVKTTAETIDDYPHAFSEINGKLKIVTAIGAKTKRDQMRDIALLYCFGNSLMGHEQSDSPKIRQAVEEHGCLDAPNFAKVFEDRTLFISDGVKGGNKKVKLTFTGRQKVKEMLVRV